MAAQIVGVAIGLVGGAFVLRAAKPDDPTLQALQRAGGSAIRSLDEALTTNPRAVSAVVAASLLCFVCWIVLISSARALLCLSLSLVGAGVAAHFGLRVVRRRGVLNLLPPELRRRFSAMTLLEWLRDDALSRRLAPYRPLLLGLSDDELALYLDSAPLATREILLRPGLGHHLPEGLQTLLFGERGRRRAATITDGTAPPLTADTPPPPAGGVATDAAAPTAAEPPYLLPSILAAAASRPRRLPPAGEPALPLVPASTAAAVVLAADSAPPSSAPPAEWQSEVIAAVLKHRFYGKVCGVLDGGGLSADVLLDWALLGSAATMLVSLLRRATSSPRSSRPLFPPVSLVLGAPTAATWLLLLVRWVADKEERSFASLRRSRALLAFGRLSGALEGHHRQVLASTIAAATPPGPAGNGEGAAAARSSRASDADDAHSVHSASSRSITPPLTRPGADEGGADGPRFGVRALNFYGVEQQPGGSVQAGVRHLLGVLRGLSSAPRERQMKVAALAAGVVFALLRLRRWARRQRQA